VVVCLTCQLAVAQTAATAKTPAPGDYINAATRERLVTDVLRELEQKFVFPKRVTEKLPGLIGRWSTAGFARITSAGELISVMNADLSDAFHDGHPFDRMSQRVQATSAALATSESTALSGRQTHDEDRMALADLQPASIQ
jgi:hypothetical protein